MEIDDDLVYRTDENGEPLLKYKGKWYKSSDFKPFDLDKYVDEKIKKYFENIKISKEDSELIITNVNKKIKKERENKMENLKETRKEMSFDERIVFDIENYLERIENYDCVIPEQEEESFYNSIHCLLGMYKKEKEKVENKIKEIEEMQVSGLTFETAKNFAIAELKELL